MEPACTKPPCDTEDLQRLPPFVKARPIRGRGFVCTELRSATIMSQKLLSYLWGWRANGACHAPCTMHHDHEREHGLAPAWSAAAAVRLAA